MENKKYNFFQALVMSFYSKNLYKDVGQNWKGVGFGYLFFLLFICWIPVFIIWLVVFTEFKTHAFPKLIASVPEVKIEKGVLSIDKPMPYIISDEETKEPFIIIDTTGKTTSLDNSPAKALVSNNQIIVRKNATQVDAYKIPTDLNYTINQTVLTQLFNDLAWWILAIALPLLFLWSFLYRIIQSVLYGAIGTLIFNHFIKAPLEYQSIVRLAIVALTPSMLLSTIFAMIFIAFPFEWTLYFILSMVYLVFGIKANKVEALVKSDNSETTAP